MLITGRSQVSYAPGCKAGPIFPIPFIQHGAGRGSAARIFIDRRAVIDITFRFSGPVPFTA